MNTKETASGHDCVGIQPNTETTGDVCRTTARFKSTNDFQNGVQWNTVVRFAIKTC